VIHRDLKLGNLFLNDRMEVKIGDFGISKVDVQQNEEVYDLALPDNHNKIKK
jgi:serine/threonine protein kinase